MKTLVMYGRGPDTPSARSGQRKRAGGDLERLSAEAKQEVSLLSSLYVRYISLP